MGSDLFGGKRHGRGAGSHRGGSSHGSRSGGHGNNYGSDYGRDSSYDGDRQGADYGSDRARRSESDSGYGRVSDMVQGSALGGLLGAMSNRQSGGHGYGRDGNQQVASRGLPRLGTGFVVVALSVWSLLAWIVYGLGGTLLSWVSTNAGSVVQTGKDAAATFGVGKEAAGLVDAPLVGGFIGQVTDFAMASLGPIVVVVWLVGALLIVATPIILRKLSRTLGFGR